MVREIGKALGAFHLIVWTALFLAPIPTPSGFVEILLAPTISLVFAALALAFEPDGLAVAAWLSAVALCALGVRFRDRPHAWAFIAAALSCLAAAGIRMAVMSASA